MRTKAARLVKHTQPLAVEEIDISEPKSGEVLLDMLYAGVNPIDRYNALGRANSDAPLPRTLGMEGVGTYEGRTVLIHGYGVGSTRDGVWSGRAVVPVEAMVDVPTGVSPQVAAAMGVAGVTAWRTVTELAQVNATDRVLVLGASGGVGSMVVSVARSLGATVWAQSGSAAKADWLRELGAEHVVVCDAESLGEASGDYSPTATLDPLGGQFTGAAIEVMARHGRLVIFGTSADGTGTVPLQQIYRKGLTIFGYAGLLTPDEVILKSIREALQAVTEGRLKVTIDSVIDLDDVNQAFDRLGERSVKGKLVLNLST